jgi:probable rRNA maturation factor
MPDRSIPASRGLAAWRAAIAPAGARGEVTVAVVSDRRMRVLNRAFRGKDCATDVLSFPIGAEAPAVPADSAGLGDIVIASGVAERQAREHRHGIGTELRLLALHGLLHLLGYDHEHPGDQGRMARAEARLRAKAGLPSGVIARVAERTVTDRSRARARGGAGRRS